MMPQNLQPNMTQAGSILPFSPTLCPTGTGFNQVLGNFPTSQSNMPSLFNSQVWRGQSITGTQVWREGQSSFFESQEQGWGGGQQSFLDLLNGRDNVNNRKQGS
ncbi:uncharacterized protein LOC131298465 [Rhododendron vialii]|uniref:uncharacterized protein LOC131298465 n=1 Tax=Rhododendron vialii TaxID=182163 RepID=UPI00265FE17C|nr:uncharacterized protein LOC131298465 [Rhododendron vialii]